MTDLTLERTLRRSRIALWIAVAAVFSFLFWAWLAELDQITRAQGQVIASSRTQVIQAVDGGVIEELRVREGDMVKRGEVLARLDRNRAEAGYQEAESKVKALTVQVARLRAEGLGRPLEFPKDLQDADAYIEAERALYQKRRTALEEELSGIERSRSLAEQELRANEPLLKTGDVSLSEVLRLRRQVSELKAASDNRRNKFFQDAQAELTKAESDLAAAQQIALQRKEAVNNTEMTAPVDGIVKNVRFTTRGAVLRPGDELMQIVPIDDDLVIEAKVRPADIAFLKIGMPANVKLDPYDYSIYGTLDGELSYISADTLAEETKQGEVTYYRIRVKTKGRHLKKRPDLEITILPGMTATVELTTGRQRVLDSLLKPVRKTLSQALTER